ncbi:YidB family protein [Hydrogenophaga sp.]|uniref:YidB family protein n=1 Tax=Hydrogenophaga sp. TaxID=1904254 RepID=UPI00260DA1BF|nr:YidB family protein [Hydrogenophaga sp.]MCW5654775.1 DUF937 domain-containing protein [Hydrogenophaga sp.]
MGLLDSLIGAAAQAGLGAPQGQNTTNTPGGLDPQMLVALLGTLLNNAGGLQGVLARLQSGGLGDAVQSWIGTGANQPVSGEQLGGALGPELLDMVARQLGSSPQQASGTLADLLPGLIDQLTPQGRMPEDNGLGALGGLLGGGGATGNAGDLMGALGGLLQGRR